MELRRVTAEDIFQIALIGDIAVHPDNHKVAVTVTHLNAEDNRYDSQIWMVQASSGEAVPFTVSDKSDTDPAWSPDGKWLAFLSNRAGDEKQLYLVPEAGGEAVQITRTASGVQSFRWHPNGRSIAFVANVAEWQKDEKLTSGEATPSPREKYTTDVKVITRTWYRLDGVGYFGHQRNHLYLVNLDSVVSTHQQLGEAAFSAKRAKPCPSRRLTEGPFDVDGFDFCPDGQSMVISSNLEADADVTMHRFLYRLPVLVPTGQPDEHPAQLASIVRLHTVPCSAESPKFAPNGRNIAFYGHNMEHFGYTQNAVWLYDFGTGETRCLTQGVDEAFGDLSLSDTRTTVHAGLTWSDDGRYLYTLMSKTGATQLVRIHANTGQVVPVTTGAHCIQTYSLNRRSTTAVVVRATAADPCNLFSLELPVGEGNPSELRRLSRWNAAWLAEVDIVRPERFQFESDGLLMDGWVMLPTTPPPAGGYPTVVQVHGGPMMMYSESFFFEFQLLVASGYAVIYSNPRGSMGYGQDFCRAIRGDWGQLDFCDVERFVDVAVGRFPLDGSNIAIAGGSYGGFMSAWAIGHTKRYKAAVVMRSVINEYSMFGTCDFGFADIYDFDCTPWQNPDRYFRVSPIQAADSIDASVLIIHSENDLRCPIEQAEQLYTALKMRNVPVEFVRFPDESHGLSRSGKPWHRVVRLEKIQSFLQRELGVIEVVAATN